MFLLDSHCKVFCPIGRTLVFVEGCQGNGCHMLFFLIVGICGYTVFPRLCCCSCNDSEEKKCAVLNLQNGSSEGGADSAGRGSDSGCECPLHKHEGLILDSRVNLLLVLPGHKPEGCKEQPNDALSV